MALDPQLLEILACPKCKTKVLESDQSLVCCDSQCRRSYEIKDGIPVMLVDESSILESDVWQKTMDSLAPSSTN